MWRGNISSANRAATLSLFEYIYYSKMKARERFDKVDKDKYISIEQIGQSAQEVVDSVKSKFQQKIQEG